MELYSYIGLNNVKNEISNLISLIRVRQEREKNGLKNPIMSYHLCFLGNPGTGKTTIARLVGKLYKQLGILKSGHLIEVARQDLVGQYIGHTAIKTKEVIDKAKGGILFIDEAYSLSNKAINDFGPEAIEVILKEMEDNRDNIVVIVAGYDDLMEEFLNSNPGLKSRFNTFIHFDDYNAKELVDIMKFLCSQNDYLITKQTEKELESYFTDVINNKDNNFSNGRYVRNMFENALKNQSRRIAKYIKIDKYDLKKLEFNDFIGKEDE